MYIETQDDVIKKDADDDDLKVADDYAPLISEFDDQ